MIFSHAVAIAECSISNTSHTIWYYETCERVTTTEYVTTNTSYTIWYY